MHFNGEARHILVDLPDRNAYSKPPQVGEAIPDVYAPLHAGGIVIGEAKTSADLENRHTEGQFRTYLKFCKLNPQSFLVVAVPWPVEALAKDRLKYIKKKENLEDVKTIVLEKLRG
ncbi:hypothetical protein HZA56_22775 [Candidatus Poribacteria bacterium]|nr:hypothetical protein [Candidatus Poribacteria bacterium]